MSSEQTAPRTSAFDRLRAAIRKAQDGSNISWPRLIATALAAVTMTLLSSRLTSVFGSLMLTAVISIGSALTAEFYRVVINMTAMGTKKVVAPIISDLEPGSETSPEPEAEEEVEERAEAEDKAAHKGERRLSQVTVLALVFGVVSLLTVGISYAVARAQGGDVYQNTTINRPVQALTPEERAALVQLAAQTAQQDLPDFAQLQSELEALRAQNEELQRLVDDLSAQHESDQAQLSELQTQTQELADQLQELAGGGEPNPTVTPDPDGG